MSVNAGAASAYIDEVCRYWREEYDWRRHYTEAVAMISASLVCPEAFITAVNAYNGNSVELDQVGVN
jgi:hypothetical protein